MLRPETKPAPLDQLSLEHRVPDLDRYIAAGEHPNYGKLIRNFDGELSVWWEHDDAKDRDSYWVVLRDRYVWSVGVGHIDDPGFPGLSTRGYRGIRLWMGFTICQNGKIYRLDDEIRNRIESMLIAGGHWLGVHDPPILR